MESLADGAALYGRVVAMSGSYRLREGRELTRRAALLAAAVEGYAVECVRLRDADGEAAPGNGELSSAMRRRKEMPRSYLNRAWIAGAPFTDCCEPMAGAGSKSQFQARYHAVMLSGSAAAGGKSAGGPARGE
ncbi:hypothetical protein [Edaphobacter aggregans]|uniref:hypothetical protein n=1 Tax=Edaphobacter aggregans TaxID=570835 RepID=UPI0005541AD5|nr:hypothetical protein [Edaphobacter aggregans]